MDANLFNFNASVSEVSLVKGLMGLKGGKGGPINQTTSLPNRAYIIKDHCSCGSDFYGFYVPSSICLVFAVSAVDAEVAFMAFTMYPAVFAWSYGTYG